MGRHRKGSRPDGVSSRAPESGAAAVEFALLASLLFMLIFGSISAGISFSRSNALQTAAREGARFAATLPDGNTQAWFEAVVDTTRAAALGELDDGVPGRTICVAYIYGASDADFSQLSTGTDPSAASPGDCFSDGLTDVPRVQVQVSRETQIQAVVFSTDIMVSGEAVARYERTGP